ncbi:MAG: hypothetical protein A2161_18135 [Candidatus Schekmanbacteria bacterium RBG_13_48_7]|uniref:Uncharacterized protein n=1 Tax=Candidatus Schekmanbacteria bacterium RBG_13_48_7 TaxID=1817878 RepID=A0A1F7RQS5_9BACT|nr:MAG: hypothetical protein A2161_18135 [Candidatus Schekmanbacteria bacterium RBG_13_48_7]
MKSLKTKIQFLLPCNRCDFVCLTILYFFLFNMFSCSSLLADQETSVNKDADRLLHFANTLFESKDYYRAITEYKRFLDYFPLDSRSDVSSFRIGLSFYQSSHMDEASEHFFQFFKEYPRSAFRPAAWFYAADSIFQKQDWSIAREEFQMMETQSSDKRLVEIALLRKAWIEVSEYKWQDAASWVQTLHERGCSLTGLSDFEKKCLEGETLPQKSPRLAGLLSAIIPGTGQIYANRYVDGIVALLLNGAFIYGAVESFNHDNPTTGSILIFFELGWYTGNIYSAINSSHRFNLYQNRTHSLLLQNTFPDLYQTNRVLFQFNFTLP